MRTIKQKDDLRESLRENERDEVVSSWMKARAGTVLSSVTARDVLTHFGVELKGSSDTEEQISCPFHGKDTKPSARVYPEGSSRSGVFCWVCQKRWDVFDLWRKFHGDEQMKFGETIKGLERAFGILPPERPQSVEYEEAETVSKQEEEYTELLEICERRLRQGKPYFTMTGYLTMGLILDRMHYAVRHKTMPPDEIETKTRAILEKIGEKIRSA